MAARISVDWLPSTGAMAKPPSTARYATALPVSAPIRSVSPRSRRTLSQGARRRPPLPSPSAGRMSIGARPPATATRTLSASTRNVGPW